MKTTRIFLDTNNQAVPRNNSEAFEEIQRVMPASFYPNGQTLAEIEEISAKEINRRKKAKANRQSKDDVIKSLGMVKVKGEVSGKIYWE